MKKRIILTLLLAALVFTGYAKVLPVPLIGQKKNNWCWAACAQMIMASYFIDKTQEQCVRVIYPGLDDRPANLNVIPRIMNNFGCSSNSNNNTTYSESQMKSQIDNEHPFAIFWHWTGQNIGHFVVIAGYSGNMFTIVDPWPPNRGARYEGTYNYVKNAKNEGYYRGTAWTTENVSPFIDLIQPNGGEKWAQGSQKSIKWKGKLNGWYGNVAIELLKGSSVKEVINNSYSHDSSYVSFAWSIGANLEGGTDYKIRVKGGSTSGQSDNTFSIVKDNVVAFPYAQDFNGFTTGTALSENWEQRVDDDIEWTCWKGKTPSREKQGQTGAEGDYPNGSGNYMYVEASTPNYPAKTASMESPKINLQSAENPMLSFQYHMYSATGTMGDLFLDICVDGKWHDKVVHIQGDQGDKWNKKALDLANYKGAKVQFRFRGVTGSSGYSDICIDDFKVFKNTSSLYQVYTRASDYSLQYHQDQVRYHVPGNKTGERVPVTIQLYGLNGKFIASLVNEYKTPGVHMVPVKNKAAAGMRLCEMRAAGFKKVIRIFIK